MKHNKIKEIADKIAVATTTWYNPNSESDNIRSRLAENSIRIGVDSGYFMIVVDGGSSDELLTKFEKYGAEVYSVSLETMGASRRKAINKAYNTGREIIAWTEPEKENYIKNIVDTARPILGGSADFVIPKRKSMKSYPLSQQHTETFCNAFCKDLTGLDLDFCFGPRTWNREVSHYFLEYDGLYGDKWDSIFIPIIHAIANKKKVIGVDVEYNHPSKQTKIEEHDLSFYKKRLEQLDNVINASYDFWEKFYTFSH